MALEIEMVYGKGDDGVCTDGVYEAVHGIGNISNFIVNIAVNSDEPNSIVNFAENYTDIMCQVIFRETPSNPCRDQ